MLLLLQKRENEKIQFRIFYRKGPSGRDKYLVSTAAKAINFNAFWTAWIHTCATLFEIRTKNVSLTCGSGSWDWPFCRRFDPFVNDYITWRCRWRTVGNSFCKNRKKNDHCHCHHHRSLGSSGCILQNTSMTLRKVQQQYTQQQF